MDTWETFFREKSERRWARHHYEKIIKRGILVVLLASVAVAVTMQVMGWPR